MSPEELAQRIAERRALPGTDAAEVEARAERLARMLAGEALLPIARHVSTRRQEGEDETAPNGEHFHVRIKASTDGLARDGGVIPLGAWENGGLANYRKNPVVMLSHGHGFPLGISVHDELDDDEGALVSWWRFHEESEESRLARRLYETGFMRAASVGFRIKDWHRPEEDEAEELREELDVGEHEEIMWVADRAELLEQSAVGVPADPDSLTAQSFGRALKNARAHGIDVAALERTVGELRRECRDGDRGACRALVMVEGEDGTRERSTEDGPGAGGCKTPEREEWEQDERAAISFSSAHEAGSYEVAPREAEWDAGAELEAMDATEDVLRPRHALVDDDADPETKTAYGFPHHRAGEGMEVVFRALAAGFARLDQADATDAEKDGVAEHLGRHYRADYDEEPPERDAVAAAVRAWPRRQSDGSYEEGDVSKYVEEHGETLEQVGGRDVALGADVVADAARERMEGDESEEPCSDGREEEDGTATDEGGEGQTGSGDGAGETGEPATGDEATDAEPAASAEPDTEGDGEERSTEERLTALEEGMGAMREAVSDLRESVERLDESDAQEDTADADGEPADSEAEPADEGEGEEEQPEADAEHMIDFDPEAVEVQEDEDGTRFFTMETPGRGEVEVELEDGQTPADVMDEIREQTLRRLRGAPLPRGGEE